mgnify:CR=1 FL=1
MRIFLRCDCRRSLLHDSAASEHGKWTCGSKTRIRAVTGCFSLERRCILNSFIPWVGGKGKLLWIISKMAPERYSRFIDVFGGSGTVTMNHPTRHGCMEVYNDFNGNLTNLFCCVKSRTLALLSELGFLPLNTRDDGDSPRRKGRRRYHPPPCGRWDHRSALHSADLWSGEIGRASCRERV